jgi:hypothetical protein
MTTVGAMKTSGAILIFLLAACLLSLGRDEESLEQLIARAESAPPAQQPDLYVQVADRELKVVVEAYKANKPEDGRAALQPLVTYADKAHTAAIQARKRVKHTEIKLRQITGRLRDVKLNVGMDDQPNVQTAIDKVETFRTELLKSMFGSKNND